MLVVTVLLRAAERAAWLLKGLIHSRVLHQAPKEPWQWHHGVCGSPQTATLALSSLSVVVAVFAVASMHAQGTEGLWAVAMAAVTLNWCFWGSRSWCNSAWP